MKLKAKVLLRRFLRGFVAGFASSAGTVGVFVGSNIRELSQWLMVVAIAGIAGGITGAILSVDKYLRWIEKPEVEN